MQNVSKWLFAICLPLLAQDGGRPPAGRSEPDVKVVYAPESAVRRERAAAVEMTPYPAPGGALALRLAEHAVPGAIVTVGSDGKVRTSCERWTDSEKKTKAAGPPAVPSKDSGHGK